jgi:hypothetical protein
MNGYLGLQMLAYYLVRVLSPRVHHIKAEGTYITLWARNHRVTHFLTASLRP